MGKKKSNPLENAYQNMDRLEASIAEDVAGCLEETRDLRKSWDTLAAEIAALVGLLPPAVNPHTSVKAVKSGDWFDPSIWVIGDNNDLEEKASEVDSPAEEEKE